MFILRKITGAGVQINITLGQSYTMVHKTYNPLEFKRTYDHAFKESYEEKEIFAFVSDESGEVLPLFPNQKNYVMTETGQTFSHIGE